MEKKAGKFITIIYNYSSMLKYTYDFLSKISGNWVASATKRFLKKRISPAGLRIPKVFVENVGRNIIIHDIWVVTIFLLLIASVIQASQPSITLSIHSKDNRAMQQAMAKVEFILQVTLHNFDTASNISSIQGMDNFLYSSAGRSVNISNYNGVSSSKTIYKFILKSDKQGEYLVGPLVCKDTTGRAITSNSLLIKVGDTLLLHKKKSGVELYQVTAFFDKKNMYIGEKNRLHIHFLDTTLQASQLKLTSLMSLDMENITILDVKQESQKISQSADGKQQSITEWIVDFYPKESGTLIFDDINVRFLDQMQDDSFFGQGFFSHFGLSMNSEKELHADPLALQILNLPIVDNYKDVTVVGQFSELIVSVASNTIEQGKGLILTADVFGDGNFEAMHAFALQLPEGLDFYDSGQPRINQNRTAERFEYVLQAQKAGKYQIPAQKLDYFDSVTHQYATLYSQPIDIIITEKSQIQQLHDQEYQQYLNDEELQDQDGQKKITDYDVLKQEYIYTHQSLNISFSWYLIIVYFLFFLIFLIFFYQYFIKKYLLSNKKIEHFIIFYKAIGACKKAEQKSDIAALHSLFMNLFIDMKIGSSGTICDEKIEQYLLVKGFNSDQIEQWQLFYSKLLQACFAKNDQQESKQLYKDSFMWLHRLRDKV